MSSQDLRHDETLLTHLLLPSYLSATVGVLITLAVGGATLLSRLAASQSWLAETLKTISESDHHLLQLHAGTGDDKLSLVLLFCFWACVGLFVYYFVVTVARGLGEISEIGREMEYVNTNRRSVLLRVLERLAVRLAGIAGLFIALALLVKVALPFLISAIEAAELQITDILTICLSVVVLLVATHLVVVMARLVVLRPRLFGADIA